jgi:hypothetical protein
LEFYINALAGVKAKDVMIDTTNSGAPSEQVVKDKEYNFAQIRKQLEAEREARLQAEARAAQAEKTAQERNVSKDDDDDRDDEPYVDHKRLQKKLANFEKNIEQKIEQKAEQKARMLIEEERKTSYMKDNNDFDKVMSPEVIQKFAERHPRLAENILRMPDGFDRQKLVYENIKALGLDKPEAKAPSIQDKINANMKSPYYQPSGVGSAPYNSAGDFSDAGQKNAYQKMKDLQKTLRL